jgi:hypothetical protein
MIVKEIEDALNATPFVPFDIHLDNGKVVHVPHPDFLLFSESKLAVVVASGGRLHIMSADHITSLSHVEREFTGAGGGPAGQ